MKKLLYSILILLVSLTGFGQQPFAEYGYNVKVATLSKGKYNEFFDQDSLVQIGTVVMNRLTGKITHFVTVDTTYSEASLQADLISRWMSPDPLAEQYYSYSPYNFVLNNPINSVDPDGQEVYFLTGQDAQKVVADLNNIFRSTYGMDYDVFKTETKSVKTQKEIKEKAEFDFTNPDTWDGEVTKTVTVNEKRTYITTDNESKFDWNQDQYSAGTFDVLNTKTQIQGEILPANTGVKIHPLSTSLGDLKGYSFKSDRKFILADNLSQTNGNDRKWSFGGTMLHETVNHFNPSFDKQYNTGLQSHFKLPYSRIDHQGSVLQKWSPQEVIRLNNLRTKGK